MKIQYLLGALFISILFTSCNGDDLKAVVPAYLTINDVTVNPGAEQGSSSDNITDVRVFINDQSLGSFELPASIPIQQTGDVNLKIRAGIFKNGLSTEREVYPFYTTYEVDTTFIPETEMILKPEVGYFSTAIFDNPWSGEDFESGINFEFHPNSDTTLVRVTDPAESFENASGLAVLSENSNFFEAWSPALVSIPRQGTIAYLEMNYKSTHDIVVSLYSNGQSLQTPIVSFRSRTDYTKVYVDIGSTISRFPNSVNYNVAIGFTKPRGEVGKLYLDNVKFVRF